MAFKMKGFKAHDMFNPKTGEKHRAKVKADHDRMDDMGYTHEDESPAKKRGLWDNIHAKRNRIKAGSGEKMRKKGAKGAPSAKNLKESQS